MLKMLSSRIILFDLRGLKITKNSSAKLKI